jgi:hypothetical protein
MSRTLVGVFRLVRCVAVAGAVWVGCASARSARPIVREPPAQSKKATPGRSERWDFIEVARASSAPERQLAEQYRKKVIIGQQSDEYMCVAREVAAHLAEYAALPDEILQRWMVGRCEAPDVFY